MRRMAPLLLPGILFACAGRTAPPLPPAAEAISLLGDTLWRPTLPDSIARQREQELARARAAYDRTPGDLDAIIWLGRRLAYLGRYRDAIDVFTDGLARFPDELRLLRHRGHRYLTLRQVDLAIADLARAARLIEGTADRVEPDGLPNDRNEPRSSLHTNIWYHLGLAYYLRGDFERAAAAYRSGLAASTNDDMRVANTYWLYMTLQRLGEQPEAETLLDPITEQTDVIENAVYLRLALMNKGHLSPDSLAPADGDASLAGATAAYGVGNWYLRHGDPDRAFAIFRQVTSWADQWPAFGALAAEAELSRLVMS